ncbi:MAG TPA: hypothetical protein VF221_09270 [Chloroflexota bacterium]
MEQTTGGQGLHGLSDAEYTELGAKLQLFWNGLSPNEQAVLNDGLRRVIEDRGDVTGHAIAEYQPLVDLIIYFLN